MRFQKTVKVISRIMSWMSLINITATSAQCLLSTMGNIKREVFYSLRQVEGPLKKNQPLFHLQKINNVLGVGEGISLQFYQGLPYQSHCFPGCSKTAGVFLQLHVHIPRAPRKGGNGFVMDTQCGGINWAKRWLQRCSPLLKLFSCMTWSSVGLLPQEAGVAGRKLPLDYIATLVVFFS